MFKTSLYIQSPISLYTTTTVAYVNIRQNFSQSVWECCYVYAYFITQCGTELNEVKYYAILKWQCWNWEVMLRIFSGCDCFRSLKNKTTGVLGWSYQNSHSILQYGTWFMCDQLLWRCYTCANNACVLRPAPPSFLLQFHPAFIKPTNSLVTNQKLGGVGNQKVYCLLHG